MKKIHNKKNENKKKRIQQHNERKKKGTNILLKKKRKTNKNEETGTRIPPQTNKHQPKNMAKSKIQLKGKKKSQKVC